MQQVVWVLGVKCYVVFELWVGVYPDGIFAPFEHSSEYCGQRAGAQLRVGNGQHVGLKAAVRHVPVKVFGTPFGVEPFLVEVFRRWWRGHVGVRFDAFLEVFPHVQDNAFMVPPVYVSLFGLFKVSLPHI